MYKQNDISYDEIFNYIDVFNTQTDLCLNTLREISKKNKIPIIKKDVENYLKIFLQIIKPQNILEIGTAVGYSSIFISKTLDDKAHIDTLEIKSDMVDIALKNIEKFNIKNINVIYGDALNTIPTLKNKYDFVFIDASKGHYEEFFNLVLDKLNKNAIILCDNILYRGLLCIDKTSIPKRQKTIYSKMSKFLENIKLRQDISYNILPLGDGLLLIYFI